MSHPGMKLSGSQNRVACALTYYLLTRSAEAAPKHLVRYLETRQPDAPPEWTFFDCWGISMQEARRAVVSSADSLSGIRGEVQPLKNHVYRCVQTRKSRRSRWFPARACCLISSVITHGSGRDEAEKKLLLCSKGSSS